MKTVTKLSYVFPIFLLFFLGMGRGNVWGQKQKITSADQLPRRTYEVKEKDFLKAIENKELVNRLAGELEQNLLADLEKYEINDPATLKAYYAALQSLASRKLDFETALTYMEKSKSLAEKEAEKLMAGTGLTAIKKAYEASGSMSGEKFEVGYAQALYEGYAQLPYEKIEETLLSTKASLELTTKDLIVGSIKAQLQPILDNMGENWDESIVSALITYETLFSVNIHLIDERLAVTNRLIEENKKNKGEKTDIWASRNVSFPSKAKKDLNPVVIGIWDTGVDMEVLEEENRYTNAQEKANDTDSDKNGYVDDLHGISFDKEARRTPSPLAPSTELSYPIAKLEALSSGFFDLQVNLQSEEAEGFKTFMKELKQDEMKPFFEDLSWYGVYSHGTHVAGIAQEGNPSAQILAARLEYSTATIPDVPNKEKSERMAQMYRDVVAYFKANGVRVVNMSWRYNALAYEGALTANGIGETPEERRAIANELFQIEKTALNEAMKNAPEILFVCGSGNENNDADFAAYIPAGLNLPNLITIGAVDIEGKKTSFTTEGKSVDFYANGHQVESFVPGGNRLKFSGTSMASPQVANLAGKLLAVYPNLNVAELISLIDEGCDVSDEGIKLINPKKSMVLLGQKLQAKD